MLPDEDLSETRDNTETPPKSRPSGHVVVRTPDGQTPAQCAIQSDHCYGSTNSQKEGENIAANSSTDSDASPTHRAGQSKPSDVAETQQPIDKHLTETKNDSPTLKANQSLNDSSTETESPGSQATNKKPRRPAKTNADDFPIVNSLDEALNRNLESQDGVDGSLQPPIVSTSRIRTISSGSQGKSMTFIQRVYDSPAPVRSASNPQDVRLVTIGGRQYIQRKIASPSAVAPKSPFAVAAGSGVRGRVHPSSQSATVGFRTSTPRVVTAPPRPRIALNSPRSEVGGDSGILSTSRSFGPGRMQLTSNRGRGSVATAAINLPQRRQPGIGSGANPMVVGQPVAGRTSTPISAAHRYQHTMSGVTPIVRQQMVKPADSPNLNLDHSTGMTNRLATSPHERLVYGSGDVERQLTTVRTASRGRTGVMRGLGGRRAAINQLSNLRSATSPVPINNKPIPVRPNVVPPTQAANEPVVQQRTVCIGIDPDTEQDMVTNNVTLSAASAKMLPHASLYVQNTANNNNVPMDNVRAHDTALACARTAGYELLTIRRLKNSRSSQPSMPSRPSAGSGRHQVRVAAMSIPQGANMEHQMSPMMSQNGADMVMEHAPQEQHPQQSRDLSLADSMMAADVLATMAVNSSPCIVGGGGAPMDTSPVTVGQPTPSRTRSPRRSAKRVGDSPASSPSRPRNVTKPALARPDKPQVNLAQYNPELGNKSHEFNNVSPDVSDTGKMALTDVPSLVHQHDGTNNKTSSINDVSDLSSLSDSDSDEDTSSTETDSAGEWAGVDYVTRCLCGLQHNDEFMIACDKCEVWQHCRCMSIPQGKPPENYLCEKCQPRTLKLTAERAREIQEKKIQKRAREKQMRIEARLKRRQKRREQKAKRRKQEQQSENLSRTEILKQYEKYGQISVNEYTTDARKFVQAQSDTSGRDLLEQLSESLCESLYVAPQTMGLVAVHHPIPAGQPVIEFRGKVCLKSECNGRDKAGRQMPHVLVYSGFTCTGGADLPTLCIDARAKGNISRFVRRSCRPNTQVKHVIANGQLHLLLVATEVIEQMGEVTAPQDFDYRSSRYPVECACGATDRDNEEDPCPVAEFNRELRKKREAQAREKRALKQRQEDEQQSKKSHKKKPSRPSAAGKKAPVTPTSAAKGKRGRPSKSPIKASAKVPPKKKVVTSTTAAANKARKRAMTSKPAPKESNTAVTATPSKSTSKVGRRATAKAGGAAAISVPPRGKIGLKVKSKSERLSLRQKLMSTKKEEEEKMKERKMEPEPEPELPKPASPVKETLEPRLSRTRRRSSASQSVEPPKKKEVVSPAKKTPAKSKSPKREESVQSETRSSRRSAASIAPVVAEKKSHKKKPAKTESNDDESRPLTREERKMRQYEEQFKRMEERRAKRQSTDGNRKSTETDGNRKSTEPTKSPTPAPSNKSAKSSKATVSSKAAATKKPADVKNTRGGRKAKRVAAAKAAATAARKAREAAKQAESSDSSDESEPEQAPVKESPKKHKEEPVKPAAGSRRAAGRTTVVEPEVETQSTVGSPSSRASRYPPRKRWAAASTRQHKEQDWNRPSSVAPGQQSTDFEGPSVVGGLIEPEPVPEDPTNSTTMPMAQSPRRTATSPPVTSSTAATGKKRWLRQAMNEKRDECSAIEVQESSPKRRRTSERLEETEAVTLLAQQADAQRTQSLTPVEAAEVLSGIAQPVSTEEASVTFDLDTMAAAVMATDPVIEAPAARRTRKKVSLDEYKKRKSVSTVDEGTSTPMASTKEHSSGFIPSMTESQLLETGRNHRLTSLPDPKQIGKTNTSLAELKARIYGQKQQMAEALLEQADEDVPPPPPPPPRTNAESASVARMSLEERLRIQFGVADDESGSPGQAEQQLVQDDVPDEGDASPEGVPILPHLINAGHRPVRQGNAPTDALPSGYQLDYPTRCKSGSAQPSDQQRRGMAGPPRR